MSLLNPVYACRFVEPGNPLALDNVQLPFRPQPGDNFTHRGVVRTIVSVTADCSGVRKAATTTPEVVPLLVVVA